MQQLASFCTDQTTHCANVKDASLEQEVLSYAPRCRMARYMHALHRVVHPVHGIPQSSYEIE
jgi:hypothetical protein